jgi:hypothetical protein
LLATCNDFHFGTGVAFIDDSGTCLASKTGHSNASKASKCKCENGVTWVDKANHNILLWVKPSWLIDGQTMALSG